MRTCAAIRVQQLGRVRRGGVGASRHGRHDPASPQRLRWRTRNSLSLREAVAHRGRARSAGREPAPRGHPARVHQATHDQADPPGRVVAHQRVTARRGRRRPRNGQADAVSGDRAGSGLEPRRHPPKRVPPLRRSLAALLELPAHPATDQARQIVDNWFHDCRGCDFIHGLFGYDLTLRGNRFERALPCRMRRRPLPAQDLVSFWSGSRLLVERNTFGVYKYGAAQLYLIRGVDRVSIVNNVFRGTDSKVRGLSGSRGDHRRQQGCEARPSRRAHRQQHHPHGGAPHRRLRRLDPDERRVLAPPAAQRPLLANNVIGLLEDPHHVCSVTRTAVSNVVLRGVACRGPNRVGKAHLDSAGRPTSGVDPTHRSREQTASALGEISTDASEASGRTSGRTSTARSPGVEGAEALMVRRRISAG